jgi:hypothetical protein
MALGLLLAIAGTGSGFWRVFIFFYYLKFELSSHSNF